MSDVTKDLPQATKRYEISCRCEDAIKKAKNWTTIKSNYRTFII